MLHNVVGDLALEGVRAVSQLSCLLWIRLQQLMNEAVSLKVNTTCHIPRSVLPLLALLLSIEFDHAYHKGLRGFACRFILQKQCYVLHPVVVRTEILYMPYCYLDYISGNQAI